MTAFFCLTLRFLDPVPAFHGRDAVGHPEWPPSPLRVFQALTGAASSRWRGDDMPERRRRAVAWLEGRHPIIVASFIQEQRTAYRMYVPHNAGDLMIAAWARGDTDTDMAEHRIEKDVRPTRFAPDQAESGTVRYLYRIAETDADFEKRKDDLLGTVRSIVYFGQGFDMVAADASVVDAEEASNFPGERWMPTADGSTSLRVPVAGTLDGLIRRHAAFINRLGPGGFKAVPPLADFSVITYESSAKTPRRPFAVFRLVNDDGSFFSYPQNRLIHLAGMVRHLAIEAMRNSPPDGVADNWLENYVAGHEQKGAAEHRQFSYLPLPSIGHFHADPSVRRVMISAPAGDERLLEHLAALLRGQPLEPTRRTNMPEPPTLVRVRADTVANMYTSTANKWASVTPVILPGHDDHKPEKTFKLVEKALAQSGIQQPCKFECSPFSYFPKALSAHKYDREKRPAGYFRPDHLLHLSAVHVRLTFDHPFTGPLAIGAGRHCGLGLFAKAE